jgi:NAD(P)H-flavin reductase
MTATMNPSRYRVCERVVETSDTVTLTLEPVDVPLPAFLPGQFAMLYAFGIGEVPISVSDRSGATGLIHTLRAVGAVTRALHDVTVGQIVGVRGPFGTTWGVPAPRGSELLIVAGGIGLAPLRPVIRHAVSQRDRYRRVVVLIGARTPADLLYPTEYEAWRAAGLDVHSTVDRADTGWNGNVGVVTTLFDRVDVDPDRTVAMLCGPEVMMRFAARGLLALGTDPQAIRVSLERNMRCGIAHCGHCQLGPLLVCRDGPVVGYDVAGPLITTKEL